MATYKGPRDASNKVTPELLFRGGFFSETVGPYVSQFLLQNTSLGALPIDQKYTTLTKGVDYMTDPTTFLQVQNGISTGLKLQPDPTPLISTTAVGWPRIPTMMCFIRRTLLHIRHAINGGDPWPFNPKSARLNPGNPYNASKTQNGFGTMGQPDIAATLAAVASEALKAVWYQKWFVHLRHRPESGGAIVHLIKTGQGNTIEGHPSLTVLNSMAVQTSFATNNSYFLSQAFPEGSPTHPSYPTGHGTVAGACITVLKFFFNGDFVIPSPQVPSNNGMALNNYTGSDAGQMTVNGELHKLAHNISFGHGIHAGIHWRSDTDTSIQLGEEIALSVLRDRAQTYNEKFAVTLKRLDGSIAIITNH